MIAPGNDVAAEYMQLSAGTASEERLATEQRARRQQCRQFRLDRLLDNLSRAARWINSSRPHIIAAHRCHAGRQEAARGDHRRLSGIEGFVG
jgi:hypothetical protein